MINLVKKYATNKNKNKIILTIFLLVCLTINFSFNASRLFVNYITFSDYFFNNLTALPITILMLAMGSIIISLFVALITYLTNGNINLIQTIRITILSSIPIALSILLNKVVFFLIVHYSATEFSGQLLNSYASTEFIIVLSAILYSVFILFRSLYIFQNINLRKLLILGVYTVIMCALVSEIAVRIASVLPPY